MLHCSKTCLYDNHLKLNAQMVNFGGWLMPVRYSGNKDEHFATRQHAGLFDVSHMGEVFLRGPNAIQAADKLLTNNISTLKINQACYSLMLDNQAKIIDDVIAYKLSEEDFIILYDDKDMNFGKIRMRKEGSAGGHNGIKSIIQYFGSTFLRIKVGIADEEKMSCQDTSSFVLDNFSKDSLQHISESIAPEIQVMIEDIISRKEF